MREREKKMGISIKVYRFVKCENPEVIKFVPYLKVLIYNWIIRR